MTRVIWLPQGLASVLWSPKIQKSGRPSCCQPALPLYSPYQRKNCVIFKQILMLGAPCRRISPEFRRCLCGLLGDDGSPGVATTDLFGLERHAARLGFLFQHRQKIGAGVTWNFFNQPLRRVRNQPGRPSCWPKSTTCSSPPGATAPSDASIALVQSGIIDNA